MKEESFNAPEPVVWSSIPLYGAIVDMGPVLTYIATHELLEPLADFVGYHEFLKYIAWDTSLGRESSTWSYIETIEQQLSDMGDVSLLERLDVEPSELAVAIRGLEDFIELEILSKLQPRIRDEFIQKGFQISKWLGSTQAILDSISSLETTHTDPRAVFRHHAYEDLGYYLGSQGHI